MRNVVTLDGRKQKQNGGNLPGHEGLVTIYLQQSAFIHSEGVSSGDKSTIHGHDASDLIRELSVTFGSGDDRSAAVGPIHTLLGFFSIRISRTGVIGI
jgi:hypothetical protein